MSTIAHSLWQEQAITVDPDEVEKQERDAA